ncbi:uncharacterized protein LOC129047159 [Molothrus ater]|uniref:uncharacterized protein LOC129047159 n=1 Tax=Molothrus ater TaxID=84834 RepID=UPI0023E8B1E5|nr:uncharacterized protein LOC129047159 [Molothrus ater]
MILTPPQTFTTLIIGLSISIVLPQDSAPIDPWSNAHQCIHPEMETEPKGSYFEVYALRNNQPYASKTWNQPALVAYKGDLIQIGCRELDLVEGKTRRLVLTIHPLMAASEHNLITFSPVKMGKPTVWTQQKGPISCQWSDFREDPPGSQPRDSVTYTEDPLGELHPQNITLDLHPLLFSAGKIVASSGPEEGKAQCEMAFRVDHSMTFTCERELKTLELGSGFPKRAVGYKVALPEDVIPLYPGLDLPQETTPLVECIAVHNLTFIGPQVIRKSNEQKLLLDPTYSLKKVQMNIHTDITYLQKDCQPFIQQSLKGWNAWLATRSHHRRAQRDISGWIGTGLGRTPEPLAHTHCDPHKTVRSIPTEHLRTTTPKNLRQPNPALPAPDGARLPAAKRLLRRAGAAPPRRPPRPRPPPPCPGTPAAPEPRARADRAAAGTGRAGAAAPAPPLPPSLARRLAPAERLGRCRAKFPVRLATARPGRQRSPSGNAPGRPRHKKRPQMQRHSPDCSPANAARAAASRN